MDTVTAKRHPILTAEGAVVGYGSTAIAGPLFFSLHSGERLALTGPNGAGKTTLLRALTGDARVLDGALTRGDGVRMALVPQQADLDPLLPTTVREFLGLARRLGAADASSLEETRDQWRLESLWHLPLRDCSGGQRQRVLLARALLMRPDLLLLDEPTTGLDRASQQQLTAELAELKSNTALLLVTHDVRLIEALGARTLELGEVAVP